MKNTANGSWERSYAYLTLENIGDAMTRNAQRAFVFKDRLTLSYETDNWQSSLYGRLTARDYHYELTPDFNSRPLSLYYGFSTRVKLGRLTLSGEIADDFNHGWLSNDMNRHRCLCNASAASRCCETKVRSRLAWTTSSISRISIPVQTRPTSALKAGAPRSAIMPTSASLITSARKENKK